MRALPNMTVFSPCDPYEVEESIYFRLAKKGEPIISNKIKIGKANYINEKEESNIAILFTGNASDIALEVEEILTKNGYSSDVVFKTI